MKKFIRKNYLAFNSNGWIQIREQKENIEMAEH